VLKLLLCPMQLKKKTVVVYLRGGLTLIAKMSLSSYLTIGVLALVTKIHGKNKIFINLQEIRHAKPNKITFL